MIKTLLVVVLLIPLFANAQTQVLYLDSDIEVSATMQNCERKDQGTHIQYYYIEVTNLSNKNLSVSFKREMWYNNKCLTCNKSNSEYIFIDTFSSKQSKKGDCFENTSRQYRVFSKMLNINSKSILTDFKITNVKVEEI